jgi:hypothetical protein
MTGKEVFNFTLLPASEKGSTSQGKQIIFRVSIALSRLPLPLSLCRKWQSELLLPLPLLPVLCYFSYHLSRSSRYD